ncbi:MAG: DUF4445 domain-containing protein [Clostridia bacterium]|nr:DUF4445 domain-containing protein [Clostridia bacterium]
MYKITLGNQILHASDGEKLSDVLLRAGLFVSHPCGGRGTCKKCTVTLNGKQELCCQYRVHGDIEVILPEHTDIASATGATLTDSKSDNICLALDIGTTTLALAPVDLDAHKIQQVITRTNPQTAFGADVISRIDYCRKHTAQPLFDVLIQEINSMIKALSVPTAKRMFVAGNTTMLHLLLNTDCTTMGTHPYTPTFLARQCVKAENLGINGVAEIITLPNISAFVGADLVAGLNLVAEPADGKYSLLVDLGTNAEVVLFSKTSILCTAAAAGPCFEGANISQGMPATDGAITAFSLDNGIPKTQTVGNAPAKGICGTGLIDIVAELLKHGDIDESGYMEDEPFEVAPDVFLEQADVRQFQLAKSAVYSAIMALLQQKKIRPADVEKLYISGGFSAKINIENAVFCGLLPAELKDKCAVLHNNSLLGTVRYACEQNDLEEIVKKAIYTDLATDPAFSQMFIENMMFEEV